MLKFVELWDRKDDQVKTFSGGMKRRLEIGSGTSSSSKNFVSRRADTGSRSSDAKPYCGSMFLNLLKTKKMTVFLTTHYLEEAEKVADRIAIVDHGKIAMMGTSKQLKKRQNKILRRSISENYRL
jgi:ABC-2 type transport system ATP-binding protein